VILTYLISVPLGIAKAVRNGSRFDTVTSVLVLVGYAVPGFVLGAAAGAVRRRHVLAGVSAARAHVGQLRRPDAARQDPRLSVAS
jgi:ABC-type dipeptide/oligopeptide/nickel transport system permease subunit